MANPATENLYLLEFLINDVNLSDGKRCDCSSADNELCVSFQFLDNQELQLCEYDFDQEKTDKSIHKIGKSCIFSLTPEQAEVALQIFDINVYVYRKLPPDKAIADAIAGTTVISATQLLTDLLEALPGAKVLEEEYNLKKNGRKVGTIDVYVRLSCYGKAIITQFQMNTNDRTVVFKDKEGRCLYRYKKRKSEKTTTIEDMASDCSGPMCYSKDGNTQIYNNLQYYDWNRMGGDPFSQPMSLSSGLMPQSLPTNDTSSMEGCCCCGTQQAAVFPCRTYDQQMECQPRTAERMWRRLGKSRE